MTVLCSVLWACSGTTPDPMQTTSPTPVPPVPETLGTFAFTASFGRLELPDGTIRQFHVHDALPAFSLDLPFAADFDGDGRHAVGILDASGTVRFGADNASGLLPEQHVVDPGRLPVAGDFDGDGSDGFGTYDPATGDVDLWHGLPTGPADRTVSVPTSRTVVAGDFDGDGTDGLAAFDPVGGDVEIRDPLTAEPQRFATGIGGYPVAGDLDGDGVDGFGVYAFDRSLTWFDASGTELDRRTLGTGVYFQWPLVGAWSTAGTLDEPTGYPYPTGDADDAGFDAALLARGVDDAGALGLTNSLLVLHRDTLVAEQYWRGFDASMANNVKSVSKSVLATLVGIAADQGLLAPDDPVSQHLPAYFGTDARADVTMRQLMTMSAGLDWVEAVSVEAMTQADDWVAFVLSQPLRETPGLAFRYSTGNTHVGAAVLEALTGTGLQGWATTHLLDPLQIRVTRWDVDPDGRAMGGAEVWMRPRDLARFGQLWLQRGEVEGTAIVSSEWVDQALTVDTPGFFGDGYGFWWRRWVLDGAEAWAAVGYGGQLVVIVPSRDLVVVATSEWSVDGATGDAQIGELYTVLDSAIVAAAPQ
ncbi:MAG: beta-lactamase family protein [Myxococcales bacterium]|nr:beta-lactamase family protein [Myxococcales bacterium]